LYLKKPKKDQKEKEMEVYEVIQLEVDEKLIFRTEIRGSWKIEADVTVVSIDQREDASEIMVKIYKIVRKEGNVPSRYIKGHVFSADCSNLFFK
jgi:ATP-dependent RNA circularization protein (DNA/RNA ligase family)